MPFLVMCFISSEIFLVRRLIERFAMDGSNYIPRHEEPHDYDVEGGRTGPLILLGILLVMVAGMLFALYREEAMRYGDCFQNGLQCVAAAPASMEY
jgi:hypothetical protein